MPLTFSPSSDDAIPVHIITPETLEISSQRLSETDRNWVETSGFRASPGSVCIFPGANGNISQVWIGLGGANDQQRGRFLVAGATEKLPTGTYRIESGVSGQALEEAALGWLLAGYSFDRYNRQDRNEAQLVAPIGIDAARTEAISAGEALTRDLINTPSSDMGPDELEQAFVELAARHNAETAVIHDEELLVQNLPMIHAVGRASDRRPRLLDMRWGDCGPTLTLVGKGVCFDTGGLNIKPASSMGLMKKDMGGAATVLGLSHMIMQMKLPLQLRVIVPAVENAIGGSAFRPQDILTSRKGLTVEINNTDAEGRLVLADALALADEEKPDCLISMATLTGAARVAVGPDLAPYYTDSDDFVAAVEKGAKSSADPVWRMPFWDPYESMIEPGIADLDNAPPGGFAGSITAALFLRRFVENTGHYAHFDIYGWQPSAKPARPKGGVGQGARAIFAALPELLNL